MLARREELSLRPNQQTEFMDLHELVHRFNLQAPRSCVLEREEEPTHQPSASDDAAFQRGSGESEVLSEPSNPISLQQIHLHLQSNPFSNL